MSARAAVRSAVLVLGVVSGDAAIAEAQAPPPCETFEVEYALAANLQLTDTPMGQGDGVYPVGPGVAVVRFEKGTAAKLVAYEMNERFSVDARTLFWKTHVTTDSKTTVGHDDCGVVAAGTLSGRTLTWTTDVRGARTDGTLTCQGSLCGSFGAPPPGTSALHIPPGDPHFSPWTFAADMKTFTMPKTWMAHSEAPKLTSHITLAGREVKRQCVTPPKC